MRTCVSLREAEAALLRRVRAPGAEEVPQRVEAWVLGQHHGLHHRLSADIEHRLSIIIEPRFDHGVTFQQQARFDRFGQEFNAAHRRRSQAGAASKEAMRLSSPSASRGRSTSMKPSGDSTLPP
jgi:hypothetical protein